MGRGRTPGSRGFAVACGVLLLAVAALRVSGAGTDTESETPAEPSEKPSAGAGKAPGPLVEVETDLGVFTIRLDPRTAPLHTANFLEHVRQRGYEGTAFHRVVRGVMIEGGDPYSRNEDPWDDGRGGGDYVLRAEVGRPLVRGAVVAARLPDQVNPERHSNGWIFFICLARLPMLDEKFTVFGEVASGMEVVDAIAAHGAERSDPESLVRINRMTLLTPPTPTPEPSSEP